MNRTLTNERPSDHAGRGIPQFTTNRSVALGGALCVLSAGCGAARVAVLHAGRDAVVPQPVAQRADGSRRGEGPRPRPEYRQIVVGQSRESKYRQVTSLDYFYLPTGRLLALTLSELKTIALKVV